MFYLSGRESVANQARTREWIIYIWRIDHYMYFNFVKLECFIFNLGSKITRSPHSHLCFTDFQFWSRTKQLWQNNWRCDATQYGTVTWPGNKACNQKFHISFVPKHCFDFAITSWWECFFPKPWTIKPEFFSPHLNFTSVCILSPWVYYVTTRIKKSCVFHLCISPFISAPKWNTTELSVTD